MYKFIILLLLVSISINTFDLFVYDVPFIYGSWLNIIMGALGLVLFIFIEHDG